MKMNWYYRLLLSYTPIFFVVISVLIFAFFTILNNSAKNQIVMTNKEISTKVMQAMDAALKASERMVIKEMTTNETIKDFFTGSTDKVLYDYFVISQKIDELSSILPFASSIYLYNGETGKVLSSSGLATLDQFGDSSFLKAAYQSGSPTGWTDPRPFQELHESNAERVISLVKFYPIAGDKRGAIVVNIRVQALNDYMKDLTRYDNGLVQLFASDHEPFDKNGPALSTLVKDKQDYQRIPIKSDYTGWFYVSGGPSDKRYSLMSAINDYWIVVGFLAIVLGLIWFTYVTHRNYKPIQAIAGRIHDYSKRKSGELVRHTAHDELKFIEAAIDGLLERSSQYEQLYKDDLLMRKRQIFIDWLDGHMAMSETQWKQEMDRLSLHAEYSRLAAAVMDIDRFLHFTASYNSRDQYLLKFVVGNVLQEIAQSNEVFAWNEWIEPHQMAVVFYLKEKDEPYEEAVWELMKKLQDWIQINLEFTVSIGIGAEVESIRDIAQSYETAKQFISYKPVFGGNSLIGSRDVRSKQQGGIIPLLQLFPNMAQSFRLGDGQWQSKLTQLYHILKEGLFSGADIKNITNYVVFHLHKEIERMPDEAQTFWKNDYKAQIEGMLEHTETVDEWHERLFHLLAELERQIRYVRSAKNNHSLMCLVKKYIEENYADPDLSLNGISERFEMNPRYLSKLFKEEFGEKFIDYMLKVRLEQAEKLLLKTDLPVQDISERVGYIHVISFHRAFKNMFGLPPGDYRKVTSK